MSISSFRHLSRTKLQPLCNRCTSRSPWKNLRSRVIMAGSLATSLSKWGIQRPRRSQTTLSRVISSRPSGPRVTPQPLSPRPPNETRGSAVGIKTSLMVTHPHVFVLPNVLRAARGQRWTLPSDKGTAHRTALLLSCLRLGSAKRLEQTGLRLRFALQVEHESEWLLGIAHRRALCEQSLVVEALGWLRRQSSRLLVAGCWGRSSVRCRIHKLFLQQSAKRLIVILRHEDSSWSYAGCTAVHF